MSDPSVVYLGKPHLKLMRKFQNRTVLTIGTTDTVSLYRAEVVRMASQYSFLLHVVLRFVLVHDRFLYDPLDTRPSEAEAFHGYHGAALFNNNIVPPLAEDENDPMWACVFMLGACCFANIDARCAEEAWPLKSPEFDDLDWLKMSDGKKAVFELANPLREGSVFRAALLADPSREQEHQLRCSNPELERLFPFVTKLYNLDSPSSPNGSKNPYQTAASIIERLIPIECDFSTVMWFLSFLGHMDIEFRRLLGVKDPQAMLLLSWWYAKIIPYDAWWMSRRARFECQGICIYLDRELPQDHEIRLLLEFPRTVSGLQSRAPI